MYCSKQHYSQQLKGGSNLSAHGGVNGEAKGRLYIKREEILQTATTWMDLEDIMLREISLSQEDKYCKIPLK